MHPVESAEEIIEAILPPRGRWRRVALVAGWILVATYFAFAALVLALRYWILPNVGAHAADIEQFATRTLGKRVAIGAIEAGWQGLRPELLLGNVTVYDRDGRPALTLPAVEATLAWTSMLVGSPRFYSLAFDRPKLEVRRDAAGKLYVAGMELHSGQGQDTGTAAWVLSQREVTIRDAGITWTDDQRGAPPLALSQVNLVIRDGSTHRFALRAKPPQELASTLEVRGELHGDDLGNPQAWSGRVYAELEYTDLAAWKPWIDYPLALESGKGGVRLWLGLADKNLGDVVADVALAHVVTRLDKDLPPLELEYLQGRLGATRDARDGYEVFGKKVSLRTGTGITLAPADFRVRWQPAADPAQQKGELDASALELAPLAKLAGYLPFPRRARERLAATDPRGTIRDLKLTWTGDAEDPQHYSLRGGFSDLAARAHGRVPEFSGLTGRIDANEQAGSLALRSEQVTVELPGVMAEDRLRLDSLTAQINWKSASDHFELGINNLSIANRDIAGTLFGTFATKEGSPGIVDVTGNFSRAGSAVYRYIPRLPQPVMDYLDASIRGGRSGDVRLRIKGDLAKFPFDDPASGIFQIIAKVDNADVRYAEGWPEAREISGDLIFEGKSMRIAASHASVLDVSGDVRVVVPDLYHGDERVQVEIRAEDQTGDFLNFISQSPVTKFLDGFTDGMRVAGGGRLSLRFDLPIRRPDGIKVEGNYEIVNNQVRLDSDVPPFLRVHGRIDFTESGVTAHAIDAQFLGGPAAISIDTRDGAFIASAKGTVSAAQLPRFRGGTILRQLSGASAWQATLTSVRHQGVTFVIRSQLTGISANLPAPLGKTAFEPMPLQVERVIAPGSSGKQGRDTIRVSLGRSVKGYFQRRREGERYVTERGVISLNEPAALPDREGITVTGSLPYLDLDRWRTLVDGEGVDAASSLSLNLKISALDFAGRRLNDLAIRAGTSGSVWIANVAAKELDGEIAWRPEGQGRIVARLKRLTMPESTAGDDDGGKLSTNLPELDIVADNLIVHDSNLGKLELVAVNPASQKLDWRIEKLILTGPESTLTADGVWRNWTARPSVDVKVKLEVSDVGKYLDRMGYPRTVQRGTAKLEGNVSWAGNPQSIDFPTLTGKLELHADKGQFLKAEPGVAKLLGVLSLQSWVTLDFPRVFGEGFGFDSISSSASIANGVLTTNNFDMRGPSAEVKMSGTTDLVRETQDLHARVIPTLGDSVSAAAILVNPIWGVPLIFIQRLLKDPLGQIFAVEYHVTGTWTKAHVERLRTDVRSAEANPQ